MKTHITTNLVKSMKFNPKKPHQEYTDTQTTGFYARPNKSGTVSFMAQIGTTRTTLGQYPMLSVESARAQVEKLSKKSGRVMSDDQLAQSIARSQVSTSTEYQIRYDIPFTENEYRNRYPFDKMEVGGCIEVTSDKESRKIRNAAYQFAKKVNRGVSERNRVAFALRKASADLFRLWRVK